MTGNQRKSDEAFTLIDTLVAIAIAGIIGSILSGLLIYFDRQRTEGRRRIQENESVVAAERVVRSVLSHAPPFLPGKSQKASIAGEAREARIISIGPPILGLPQTVVFSLRVRELGETRDLVFAWTGDDGIKREEILARSVSDFMIEYFSREMGRPGQWSQQTSAESSLTIALRISLRFRLSASDHVIVVPVESELPTICLRDPRQTGCGRRE